MDHAHMRVANSFLAHRFFLKAVYEVFESSSPLRLIVNMELGD